MCLQNSSDEVNNLNKKMMSLYEQNDRSIQMI